MTQPYIHLLTKNDYVLFKNNEVIIETKDYHRDNVFNLVYEEDWTIVILEMDYFDCEKVINFLINKKVKKVAFIINDVFRIKHKIKFIPPLDSSFIEKDLSNISFSEIQIIKKIIKKSNILEYKIFHCEKMPKYLQDFVKLEVNYYDLFLYQWISYQRRTLNIKHHNNFTYKVSSFNKRYEEYRILLTALLHENKDFYYTLCQLDLKQNLFKNFNNFDNKFKTFITEKCNSLYQTPLKQIKENRDLDLYLYNTIQNSFLHLVNETRFYSPMQNLSEKSIRPIISKRPFVLAAAPRSLRLLKSLGFKTFDQWWDESYDDEPDHHKRLIMVYRLIDQFLNKDHQELKQVLEDQKSVLDYNYEVYLNFRAKIYQTI